MAQKQALYRINFSRMTAKTTSSHLPEMFCENWNQTLDGLKKTVLADYRRADSQSIGTSDYPCDRHIYEHKRDYQDRILIYVYPPR